MNYYPYISYLPTSFSSTTPTSGGLISRLFRNGINWGGIINNTQKTLNIINQAIPMVKQVTPVVKNAKTMFTVLNEFKKTDSPKKTNNYVSTKQEKNKKQNTSIVFDIKDKNDGPTFFA